MYGWGGNASPFPVDYDYPEGYNNEYAPSLIRVTDSSEVKLCNLIDLVKPYGGSVDQYMGESFNPNLWSFVNVDGQSTDILDRPVLVYVK